MRIYKHLTLLVIFLALFSIPIFSQKMKAEDVLAKHLDSIGTAEARSVNISRIIVGNGDAKFISQKNLSAQGGIVLASVGDKIFWGLSLNAADYPTEKFSYDGKKVRVGFVRAGQRTILGNFILSNDVVLEESLFGGAHSTSWALLNMPDKKAGLSFRGTKKINDKEVYVLSYSPKKSDLDVQLFFDKETFRHIRTEYKRTFSASMGRTIDESARQQESRLKVVENFSDFKEEKGLTLPHGYNLLYSITGQNGTTEIEWNFNLNEFAFNQNISAETFDAEKN